MTAHPRLDARGPARGIRNNNPGNIDRNGIAWQGMAKDQSGDARFIVFDSPLYGIRALAKVLLAPTNTTQETYERHTHHQRGAPWLRKISRSK